MSNRREFLKRTAAGAAALWWMPLPALASQGSGPEEKIMGAYTVLLSAYPTLATDYKSVEIFVSSTGTRFRLTRVPGPVYYAVDTICTHQGCTIGTYSSSKHYFTCPCHGAEYNANGSVKLGPATQALKSYAVTVVDSNTLHVEIPGYTDFSPVQISYLNAAFKTDHVEIDWTTASEMNNAGFMIDRRTSSDLPWVQMNASMIVGNGTTSDPHQYSYQDYTVAPGTSYQYRLRQIDVNGTSSNENVVAVAVPAGVHDGEQSFPSSHTLSQNYPDPFSSTTRWGYALSHDDRVKIAVSDMQGRVVNTLVDASHVRGEYHATWDGRDASGAQLPSGTFIITLQSSDGVISRMVRLVR